MKLSPELNDLFNKQVEHEYSNELRYRQIEAYFQNKRLMNLAEYFRKQADEESGHAKKFINHIHQRTGGIYKVYGIEPDQLEITDKYSVGNLYVQIEENTSELIEELFKYAFDSGSFIDLGFIQSMLDEQIQEEDSATEFLEKISNVSDLVLFDATFK